MARSAQRSRSGGGSSTAPAGVEGPTEPHTYAVVITQGAVGDLDEIVGYVAQHDRPGKAAALLDKLLATAETLAHFPHRGTVPAELRSLGITDFRQTLFKPYRLIYAISEQPQPEVQVLLVAHSRRDLTELLQQRLLRAP